MLAYPLDEAETLLDGRLSNAKKNQENCEEDLEFLREQITVRSHYSLIYFASSTAKGERLIFFFVLADNGGCNSSSVQLGCRTEAEGEGRR